MAMCFSLADVLAEQSKARITNRVEQVLSELLLNAVIFEPLTGDTQALLDENTGAEGAFETTEMRLVTRAQAATVAFTVMSRTNYGSVVLGHVMSRRAQSTSSLDVEFTSTLPASIFSVKELAFVATTGKWAITIETHGSTANDADLNSTSSELGRIVRFSVIESIVGADASDINFSQVSSDRRSVLRRAAGV